MAKKFSRSKKYTLKTVTIKKGKNKGKRVKRYVLKKKYK